MTSNAVKLKLIRLMAYKEIKSKISYINSICKYKACFTAAVIHFKLSSSCSGSFSNIKMDLII